MIKTNLYPINKRIIATQTNADAHDVVSTLTISETQKRIYGSEDHDDSLKKHYINSHT